MRIAYFDEAGSSQDEVQEPIITVAAVVIHGDLQTLPVEHDAEEIIRRYVPVRFHDGFEFHGKELYSGSERLRGWEREGRHSALRAFLGLVAKHNLPVMHVSLDKKAFREGTQAKYNTDSGPDWKYVPHQAAFVSCATYVEGWFRKYVPFERAFCIADETKAKQVLRHSFRDLRKGLLIEETEALVKFDHLIDTIYFGDSHQSVFLQLVDCCAFVIKRMAMRRRFMQSFYDEIRAQISPKDLRVHFAPPEN